MKSRKGDAYSIKILDPNKDKFASDLAKDNLIKRCLKNALGFTGIEIIRRIVTVGQVDDLEKIKNPYDRYKSEIKKHPFPRSIESIKALAVLRGSQSGYKFAEEPTNPKEKYDLIPVYGKRIYNTIYNNLFDLSFGMGAIAGLAGDKWSLGFVAETEDQVCKHLEDHLTKLPEQDGKSKAILEQMIKDERQHGETAKEAGGADLPLPVKQAMASMAQVMKKTTYHI